MPIARGVPEVPTKLDNGPQHRRFLVDMREQVLQLRGRLAVPPNPSNLRATAQGFAILIQWTQSNDADYYELLKSPNGQMNSSTLQTIDVGNCSSYTDYVGQAGITYFYWLRARKSTGSASANVGPVSATTLAAGTGVTPPPPPPPANILVVDSATGLAVPYTLSGNVRIYPGSTGKV